ncbi:Heat shock protein. Metallo peptidase. MEROPS family M48B [Colwellia chukchiensis]|uniref:Protease HtpX n=1 Tax=Colwellia chukchiensis TaxID=641665 RepID=A0A1H7RFC2_9GAMM|nr:protease HtpX [Colwellia chukchiensis]SEL58698.1 Heat shock protein. Metallo peptidase. MEROPS family M48B [Colwellia chukchiensis]
MQRIALFLLTNLAIMLVLSVTLSMLMTAFGIDRQGLGGLLMLACVFGFGGAFISLLMSKWLAKRSVGAYVIEQPRNNTEQWLLATVQRYAKQAGIGMPEVALYQSPDMNAFATGANRNNALVAISTGLLDNMSQTEAEAVIGHEISHIANGDMVTLTLIQGVVNTFVIFLARLIAGVIDNATRGNNNQGGLGTFAYFGVVLVLEMILGVLASIIVAWFSRKREYRADIGGAQLAGRSAMIGALEKLKRSQESQLDGTMLAFGINNKSKMLSLFASHPPLDERIAALRNAQ